MKANELRIGNKLQKTNGEIFTVSRLDNTNDVQVLEERGLLTLGYNLLGIPLTEEWLLKFGFGKTIGYFITLNPNIVLELSENNDNETTQWYCYVRNLNGPSTLDDDFSLLRKDLQHVHQLQNLYFALTGEELTIKDDVGN